MNSHIVSFELGGKPALGFDTGLDSQAFAQAKLASFITQPGRIVHPDGALESWLPGGVLERDGTMVVWGPAFSGEGLDTLLVDEGRKDEALDALRYWIQARLAARSAGEEDPPWPAGALIAGPGAVFFPPLRLIKRCLEAEGPEAWRTGVEQWTHPDLKGPDAAAFSAGAMLYRILCAEAPFPREDVDLLRQDIREGVFLPPALAAPGLEDEAAALIAGTLAPVSKGQGEKPRPLGEKLEKMEKLLGPPGSRKADSFIQPLGTEERAVLAQERERFSKRKDLTVNTKRFVIRNTAIITGMFIILLFAGLVAHSIIRSRLDLPTTRDMSPREVVSAYYGAFGDLDHQLMEACLLGKAGKEDVSMVTNFFVLSRVQQAYEMGNAGYISAQKWLDAGSPDIPNPIFGVTDLKFEVQEGNAGAGELFFRVSYRFWIPASATEDIETLRERDPEKPLPPQSFLYADELRLALHKDMWRIAEIRRESR